MALIQCRECGSKVSSSAAACPQCGNPVSIKKTSKDLGVREVLASLVILVIAVWVYNAFAGYSDSSSPSTSAHAHSAAAIASKKDVEPEGFDNVDHYNHNSVVSTAKCQKNLACWSDRLLVDAEVDCKPRIEQEATHSVKWNDGFLHPMFERIGWGISNNEIDNTKIRYIGDKVEFQNGFGALTPMTYVCTLDSSSKKVIDVQVSEGRLVEN